MKTVRTFKTASDITEDILRVSWEDVEPGDMLWEPGLAAFGREVRSVTPSRALFDIGWISRSDMRRLVGEHFLIAWTRREESA